LPAEWQRSHPERTGFRADEWRGNHGEAVDGNSRKSQEDPHWRDRVSFYEYFHGDTGAGDWGLVIKRARQASSPARCTCFATTTPEQALQLGKMAAFREIPLRGREAKAAAVSGGNEE
jgi:hypothetical protein